MNILIDSNIRAAGAIFEHHGHVRAMDGRAIGPGDVKDVDALIVRSVTPVNKALLSESQVRFVGTTTIGTDHLDTQWLDQAGIEWCSAPGCNADAASQYTLSMLWLACRRLDRNPFDQTIGIIGRGNVGSRLHALVSALGCRAVANDPPLQAQGQAGLVSLEEALAQDIVCLHVPLTRDGRWPTHHLLNAERLQQMKPGSLLINSSRGNVVDGPALLRQITAGRLDAALDVWPNEPDLDPELLNRTTVATPHVAGYSNDGKLNGVLQVYREFCNWSGHSLQPLPEATPEPDVLSPRDPFTALDEILEAACFVPTHDDAMRELATLSPMERVQRFDQLRKNYPSRRDFKAWKIKAPDLETGRICRNLGFSLIESDGAVRD